MAPDSRGDAMNTMQRLSRDRFDYRQGLGACCGLAIGLTVFFALERLVTPRVVMATRFDARIPFVSLTWFIYVAFFPFVIVLAARAPRDAYRAFARAVLLAFAVGAVCFVLVPESVPRPEVASIDNVFVRHRLARMWQLDRAGNGFPSLHVAVTCLACCFLTEGRRRIAAVVFGIAICVSTLTIKQHTLADVGGGVGLAVCCAYGAVRTERWGGYGVA
jgi:membrane-associated phospholipid phosphatase